MARPNLPPPTNETGSLREKNRQHDGRIKQGLAQKRTIFLPTHLPENQTLYPADLSYSSGPSYKPAPFTSTTINKSAVIYLMVFSSHQESRAHLGPIYTLNLFVCLS